MARQGEWFDGQPWPGSPLDPSSGVAKGLKACWLCNDGAGGSLREAVTGTQGVLSSTSTTPPAWSASRKGTVLTFDGSTSYVSSVVPSGYLDFMPATGVYSIAARFKLRDYTQLNPILNTYPIAILGGNYSSNDTSVFFGYHPQYQAVLLRMTVGSATSPACTPWADGVVADNDWHTAVAVPFTSGNNGVVYYDGYDRTDFNNGFGGTSGALTSAPTIGRDPGGQSFWDGLIDIVCVWDRQLSATEAQSWSEDPYQVFAVTPFWMNLVANPLAPVIPFGCMISMP